MYGRVKEISISAIFLMKEHVEAAKLISESSHQIRVFLIVRTIFSGSRFFIVC
jgi:hypothetical protein